MSDPIAEAITEWWGERCEEYAEGCHACEAWKAYDALRAAERRAYERAAATLMAIEPKEPFNCSPEYLADGRPTSEWIEGYGVACLEGRTAILSLSSEDDGLGALAECKLLQLNPHCSRDFEMAADSIPTDEKDDGVPRLELRISRSGKVLVRLRGLRIIYVGQWGNDAGGEWLDLQSVVNTFSYKIDKGFAVVSEGRGRDD